ncbi:hypothetical protein L914_06777 [Phytophthora nicotianae]|uniref:Uncharacterized protein n=1 Tax=Phytophthora nicotianae TaxID=4792 RepID=W2NJL5_PHYNI|nr:hypothetical protein L914_06777 [Phytophthora nicotianae]
MKRLAEKDPDLRNIAPLVGTTPSYLSAKQVESMQSFVKKHPEDGIDILAVITFIGFSTFMLVMPVALIGTVFLGGSSASYGAT